MQKTCGILNLKLVSLQTLSFGGYLCMIAIPAVLLNPIPYNSFLNVLSPQQTFQQTVLFGLFGYATGTFIISKILGFKVEEQKKYFSKKIKKDFYKHSYLATILLSIMSVFIMGLYFVQIGLALQDYPIFKMFSSNNINELAFAREKVFKLVDPRWNASPAAYLFFFYLGLRVWLFPFLVIYSFLSFLVTREKRWLFLFGLNLVHSVFYAALSIARAPVAALVLRLVLAWHYFRLCVIGKFQTALVIFLVLFFPLLVTTLAYGHENPASGLTAVIRRLFITPADDLYVYFQAFPVYFDFQQGGTLLKPFLHLFRQDHFYIENEIYKFQFPFSDIKSGHANAAFLGNLYADFGPFGSIIGSIFTGLIIQFFNIFLCRSEKNIMNVTLYAYLVYSLWIINFGSLTSVLGTNGVIFIFLMPVVYTFLDKVLNLINKIKC
jgi:oligosaccharide repeat unit polymerase